MKRTLIWIPIILLLGRSLVCCSFNDNATLELPDGDTIPWGGSIRVVALLQEQGGDAQSGKKATFTTTVGSFEPFESASDEPLQEIEATTTTGQAEATLYSFPGEGGKEGSVSVEYLTIGSATVTDSITVLSQAGGLPSGKSFTATCVPNNVSVYANEAERQGMRIQCTVTAKDASGQSVPRADIKAMVESDCSVTLEKYDESLNAYIFALQPDCDPMNVEPMMGEPSHMDETYEIRNPRDGLLTIIFYTEGQEGFMDSNGNGVYDTGESFVGHDLAEPYLDSNDNNMWDTGEPWVDANNNQTWDYPDGRWNDSTTIWTSVRIMFTGAPHASNDTSHYDPNGISIQNGGSQTFAIYLMDENHNPIASNSSSDKVTFSVSGARISGASSVDLVPSMGIDFHLDGSVQTESFSEHRQYQVILEDNTSGDEPHTATLDAEATWTPSLSFSGYSAQRQTADLPTISGTVH
ncbi:MAG: hypothetical protein JRF33_05810 [Deltaproteobacteria bacterium]|nr:hypothetical protein [Deltaproteobacteria bacterium]